MALIGAIIGDIIGSRFEFPSQRPDDIDWQNIDLFSPFCEYTDDTVMAIATKFALDKNIPFDVSYRRFGKIYPDVGYGDMFYKWLNNVNMSAYGSFGNGSAMRIPYIADYVLKNRDIGLAGLMKLAKQSAKCTHNNPRGIIGASTTANIIYICLTNRFDKDYMLNLLISQIYKDCLYTGNENLEELRKTYRWSETCDNTVPIAFRCFYESTDYESCIRNCLSLPCDMDTVMCIAGAMAEAYYGTTGFDNEKILKQYLPTSLFNLVKDML